MQAIPSAQELMSPLNFTAQDLEANRAGKLGHEQVERLKALQKRTLIVALIGFFAFAIISTTLLFFATGANANFLTLLSIFLSFLNAIFVGMLARDYLRLGADMRSGEVELLSGKLERVIRQGGRMNNFVLRIAGVDFYVKKEVFALFRHEENYAFYRARHSGVLLAAEPK